MDVKNWFTGQIVAEGEMDEAFSLVEAYQKKFATDNSLYGIVKGLVASLGAGTTFDVTSGTAFDQLGRIIPAYKDGSLTKNFSYATATSGASTTVTTVGNERWISVFAKWGRKTSDTRTDINGNSVDFDVEDALNSTGVNANVDKFFILVGTEAALGAGVRPSLQSDCVLVCDIKRTYLDGANTIDTTRREDYIVSSGTPRSLRSNNVLQALTALLGFYNNHVNAGTADRHGGGDIDLASGSAWLDGTTNPAATLITRLNKIITDLSDQTGTTADGASRIGAEARGSMPQGSVGSQLTYLITNCIQAAANNTFNGNNTFTGDVTLGTSATAKKKLRDRNQSSGDAEYLKPALYVENESGNTAGFHCVFGLEPSISGNGGGGNEGVRVYMGTLGFAITYNCRIATNSTTGRFTCDVAGSGAMALVFESAIATSGQEGGLSVLWKNATISPTTWNASAWDAQWKLINSHANAISSLTVSNNFGSSATQVSLYDAYSGFSYVIEGNNATGSPAYYFGGQARNDAASTQPLGGYQRFNAALLSSPSGGSISAATTELSVTNSGSSSPTISAIDTDGFGFRWQITMAAGPTSVTGFYKVQFTN